MNASLFLPSEGFLSGHSHLGPSMGPLTTEQPHVLRTSERITHTPTFFSRSLLKTPSLSLSSSQQSLLWLTQSQPTWDFTFCKISSLVSCNTAHRMKPIISSPVVQLLSLIQHLCNPVDCSLPGPSIHGIFQARMLEWVVISLPTLKWRASSSGVWKTWGPSQNSAYHSTMIQSDTMLKLSFR